MPKPLHGTFGIGDTWTWVAFDADSKLIISWLVGQQTVEWACEFLADIRNRLANRVPLTTDGHRPYLQATDQAFNWDVDYATLEKHYGMDQNKGESRYSPAKLQSIEVCSICGTRDEAHISTGFTERQNLTRRIGMRRFTRLTNGFSKKVQSLEAAFSLHFMYYNFARVRKTLRTIPAMVAGISDHVWAEKES